jgi:hypothetical protein
MAGYFLSSSFASMYARTQSEISDYLELLTERIVSAVGAEVIESHVSTTLGSTYREPTRVDKTVGGLLCRLRMSRSIVIATGSLAGNVSMSASSSNSSKCSASVVSSDEKRSTALGNEAGFLSAGSMITVEISYNCSISIDKKGSCYSFF